MCCVSPRPLQQHQRYWPELQLSRRRQRRQQLAQPAVVVDRPTSTSAGATNTNPKIGGDNGAPQANMSQPRHHHANPCCDDADLMVPSDLFGRPGRDQLRNFYIVCTQCEQTHSQTHQPATSGLAGYRHTRSATRRPKRGMDVPAPYSVSARSNANFSESVHDTDFLAGAGSAVSFTVNTLYCHSTPDHTREKSGREGERETHPEI